MKNLYNFILGILLILFFVGCGKSKFPEWDYKAERENITLVSDDQMLDIDAEIFADATVSMSGFSTDPNSRYNKFIDDLSSVVQTAFKSSKVKFFRFGANSTEIAEAKFLEAKKPSFYSESLTNIDEVIKQTKKTKISIVLTDLFQDQKNLIAVVTNLKTSCLEKGLSLAILGIASEFDGKVYDANVAPFDYKTTEKSPATFRPFYAFMIGSDVHLEKFYKNLAGKNPGYKDNFILITNKYVSNFEVVVDKDKESKGLKKKRSDDNDPFNSSHFWVMSTPSQKFNLVWKLQFPGYVPPLNSENIKFVVKKQVYDPKSESYSKEEDTKDLQIKVTDGTPGSKITSAVVTSESISKGTSGYKIFMEVDPDTRVSLPKWVTNFSSDDPSPSRGPNKTLNLEKFVSDLIKASWVLGQPKLGVAFLTINVEK